MEPGVAQRFGTPGCGQPRAASAMALVGCGSLSPGSRAAWSAPPHSSSLGLRGAVCCLMKCHLKARSDRGGKGHLSSMSSLMWIFLLAGSPGEWRLLQFLMGKHWPTASCSFCFRDRPRKRCPQEWSRSSSREEQLCFLSRSGRSVPVPVAAPVLVPVPSGAPSEQLSPFLDQDSFLPLHT